MATKIVDVRAWSPGAKADLPPMTKVVHVSYTDPDTGLLYAGEFTIKRMTLAEIARVGVRNAERCAGQAPETLGKLVQSINMMLSHLEGAIVKAPDWWRPEHFYSTNFNIVVDVYNEVMKFEDSFRVPASERAQGIAAHSEMATTNGGRSATPMVDEQVSASANF